MQINNKSEKRAWYLYDFAASAFSTTIITVLIGPYLTEIASTAADADGFIYPLGIKVFYGSFFAYCISISVMLQVFILPLLGSFADYSNRKKHLLAGFAYIGAISATLLFFLRGDMFLYGGILLIISNLSYGASIVFYNAFLNEIATADERDSVSSKGFAWGYVGGGSLLAINLILLANHEELGLTMGYAVRICLASAGIWWAIFTIFPLLKLKMRRPVKSIPKGHNIFTIGFKQFFATIKEARKYPKTLMFLIAYLFYNDGVQTVIVIAAQFGQEELGLDMATLTTVILMVQFFAIIGAMGFNLLAAKYNSKNALLITLVIWSSTLIYAYFWLRTTFDFYIMAAVIALVLGGTQALSRSLFSLMIPQGKESEYFSVYEISERGTSWIGPLVFGIALQMTGSYRVAILSLIAFFIIGFVLLILTNVKQAILESGNELPEVYK